MIFINNVYHLSSVQVLMEDWRSSQQVVKSECSCFYINSDASMKSRKQAPLQDEFQEFDMILQHIQLKQNLQTSLTTNTAYSTMRNIYIFFSRQ